MTWTLVTGGAKRLGKHLCVALAQNGYNVVVHYNTSKTDALEVVRICKKYGTDAAAIQGDFNSHESLHIFIDRYLQEFPETVNLVNNVGNYLVKSLLNTTVEEWQELFQINLFAPLELIKALSPSIIMQRGNIINIGVSGIEHNPIGKHSSAYRLTKFNLLNLTKSIAKELAPHQVKVNMISPGYLDISVETPSPSMVPMGNLISCDEISSVLIFLLNEKVKNITGQNIEVAGGAGL